MKTYQPECKSLPSDPGIVTSARIRSTFDIAWTCLSVVFLCTWVVMHLTVPAETVKLDLRRKFYLTGRAVWWGLVGFFAPELIAGPAAVRYLNARHLRKMIAVWATRDTVIWTVTHTFLANMGGFSIEFDDDAGQPADLNLLPVDQEPRTNSLDEGQTSVGASPHRASTLPTVATRTLTTLAARKTQDPTSENTKQLRREIKSLEQHRRSLSSSLLPLSPLVSRITSDMPWKVHKSNDKMVREVLNKLEPEHIGNHSPRSYFDNVMALRGNIWVLDGRQLLEARKRGIVDKLPSVTEAEIEDRSKGDVVTKFLALLQTLWFVAELALRTAEQLPISQIEIHTTAMVACSTIAYAGNWYKPQNVMTRIKIRANRLPDVTDIREIGSQGGNPHWFRRTPTYIGNDNIQNGGITVGGVGGRINEALPIHISVVSLALIFAGIHFAAWNLVFPSQQEQLCWRIACLTLLVTPVLISVMTLHAEYLARRDLATKSLAVVESNTTVFLIMLYVIARLFILVEVVRTLFYLPARAYIATSLWDLPHWG